MQPVKFDWFHLGLAVLFLVAAGLGFDSWRKQHDAALTLGATLTAQKSVIADVQQREADRDKALAQTLADFAKQKDAVRTPAQAAAAIPRELNSALPQPITINIPQPDHTLLPGETPPAAKADVPIADLKPLNDMIIDCQACRAKLAEAQADVADENLKIGALEKERDAAIKAAHGTFWSNLKTGTKHILIGLVVGAVAVCASGHCR